MAIWMFHSDRQVCDSHYIIYLCLFPFLLFFLNKAHRPEIMACNYKTVNLTPCVCRTGKISYAEFTQNIIYLPRSIDEDNNNVSECDVVFTDLTVVISKYLNVIKITVVCCFPCTRCVRFVSLEKQNNR